LKNETEDGQTWNSYYSHFLTVGTDTPSRSLPLAVAIFQAIKGWECDGLGTRLRMITQSYAR